MDECHTSKTPAAGGRLLPEHEARKVEWHALTEFGPGDGRLLDDLTGSLAVGPLSGRCSLLSSLPQR